MAGKPGFGWPGASLPDSARRQINSDKHSDFLHKVLPDGDGPWLRSTGWTSRWWGGSVPAPHPIMSAPESKTRVWSKIFVYYALANLGTGFFTLLMQHTPPNLTLTTGAMWSPALAAFVTTWLFGGRVRDFAWGWGSGRYQWLAYVIPFLYAVPVYLVVWVTGLGGFFNPAAAAKIATDYGLTALSPGVAFAVYAIISLTVGFVPKTGRALGEEIGWRGFLVPELSKVTGFVGTSVISGLMWSAWHYPAILLTDYNGGTPPWFGIGCFTAAVVGESFIFTWLTQRSRSLWPAAFLHGAHNTLIQLVLTPATRDTGRTAWIIDEFGIGLVVTCTIAAIIVWRMHAADKPAAAAGG